MNPPYANNDHSGGGGDEERPSRKQLLLPSADVTAYETTLDGSSATSLNGPREDELLAQRQSLRAQNAVLGLATTTSAGIVLLTVVPASVLVGFAMVVFLMYMLVRSLYQRAIVEYQLAVQGRGIGDYLPESWFEALVNSSLHEYLTGSGSFDTDYSFLAIYFIPGLTSEQRDAYARRLNPRHRDLLQRRGLGNFLGDQFMRVIVGDQRLDHVDRLDQRPVPRNLRFSPNAIEDDLTSELEVEPRSRSRGLQAAQTTEPDAVDDSSESEESEVDENQVLSDAVTDGLANAVSFVLSYFAGTTRRFASASMDFAVRTGVPASLAITAVSTGIGLFGFWAGVYGGSNNGSVSQPSRIPVSFRSLFPSASFLRTTAMASGTSATILMMFGQTRKSRRRRSK